MKNIYLAAILSLFIPGLGVAYLGLYKRFLSLNKQPNSQASFLSGRRSFFMQTFLFPT